MMGYNMNINMIRILNVATLFVFSSLTASAIAVSPDSGDRLLSEDYSASDFPTQAAGKILKKTRVEGKYAITNADEVYKVFYTATDGVNSKVRINSGIIFLPAGNPPKNGWPVVSWQHGTTGIADRCAPSWTGPDQPSKVVISSWIAAGYAVVAADYQGLGMPGIHPYLEPKSLAYSVLDLLKASLAAELGLQNTIVLHGWSEGGAATIATALYAQKYAPALHITGASSSGAPYITPKTLRFLASDKTGSAEVVSYVTYLLNSASQLGADLPEDDVFSAKGKQFVRTYGNYCVDDLVREATINKSELNEIVNRKAFGNQLLLEKIAYPPFKTEIPLFLSIGGSDTDVPTNMQLALQQKMCADGANLSYKVYSAADHTATLLASVEDTIVFLSGTQEKNEDSTFTALSCKN